MQPGDMLTKLHEAEDALPDLLREGVDAWESLDIDYEPPRVCRLWRQWGDFRILLHHIELCGKALFHPHPWPSAVRVINGTYEMAVGFAESDWQKAGRNFEGFGYEGPRGPLEVARIVLGKGAQYEMTDPNGWHYVKPLFGSSLSVMVIGKPYEYQPFSHDNFGKKATLRALDPKAKNALHAEFIAEYHYWRANR